MDELIADTTLEDVGESCRPLVELIGLENVLKLSAYSMGDKIYFPKVERLIAPARNRRIRKEYNGFNIKELAQAYDLTTNQIMNRSWVVRQPLLLEMQLNMSSVV